MLSVVIWWKVANISVSYLIGRLFDNCRSVLKYYSLLYLGTMAIFELLSFLTGLAFFKNFSDLLNLIQYFLGNTGNYTQVFLFQIFASWLIILLSENYQMKFNYSVQNLKAPSLEANKLYSKPHHLSNSYLDTKNFVQEEEDYVRQNTNLFFKAQNLFKQYRSWFSTQKVAIRNISFGIEQGVSFGLVGPNGAGKSTTFNVILNKVIKSGGKVDLKNMKKSEGLLGLQNQMIFSQFNFGVAFQGNALWGKLSVRQNLWFYRDLNNVREEALLELVQYLEFEQYLDKQVFQLSNGNKRKLCIILSLLRDPVFLLMDEATCGVDLIIRLKLKKIFDYLKERHRTASIFTTHFLKDIEIFCDKIGMIDNGQFLCVDYI